MLRFANETAASSGPARRPCRRWGAAGTTPGRCSATTASLHCTYTAVKWVTHHLLHVTTIRYCVASQLTQASYLVRKWRKNLYIIKKKDIIWTQTVSKCIVSFDFNELFTVFIWRQEKTRFLRSLLLFTKEIRQRLWINKACALGRCFLKLNRCFKCFLCGDIFKFYVPGLALFV